MLRQIGAVYVYAGGLFTLAWLYILFELPSLMNPRNPNRSTADWEAELVAFIIFPILAYLYIKTGREIRVYKRSACKTGVYLGALLLLGFPIGTIIGFYAMVKLSSQKYVDAMIE